MFGGPGHDVLLGFRSPDSPEQKNYLYGGDGDDILFHLYGNAEISGGAGDDILEGG